MKKFSRIIALITAVLMIATCSYAAEITFENAEINGSDISIDIMLDEIPSDISDVSAVTIKYNYDKDKMTYVGTTPGLCKIDNAREGYIIWYDASVGANMITGEKLAQAENKLITLNFTAVDEVPEGTAEIDVTFVEIADSSIKISEEVTYSSGIIDFDMEADKKAAKAVDELINAIGEVTLESEEAINTAREAYDALTDNQKAYVEGLSILEEAEIAFTIAIANKIAVETVIAKIDAIGEVIYPDSKEAIDEAKEAYDELSDDLKAQVTNAGVLEEAVAKYAKLEADYNAVQTVIEKIDAIGEVVYPDSGKAIDEAQKAYDELSGDLKAQVTNINVLEAAKVKYAELEADYNVAKAVIEKIDAIGEVVYPDSKEAIDEAQKAYDELSESHKALVSNINVLEEAVAKYAELEANYNAVQAVIAKIDVIGEVTYPDSKEAIDEAQKAYDELSDDLKAQVTNINVLEAAKAKYAELEADYNAVQSVIEKIDAIGEVVYPDSKKAIDEAQKAYDELSDDLKAQVTNINVLEAAKAKYEELKPKAEVTQDPVEQYGNVHVIVFTNIPEGKIVTLGTIIAQMVKVGSSVYYVAVTPTAFDPVEVVVEEGSSDTFKVGDTDGNGEVTATDALGANQKSAHLDVEVYNNDPMAFVRSDINGSGTITALDALLIARIASGTEVETSFVAGK